MASDINPNNIDGTYPIAGIDNDTQGFRTNFTNTSTNFAEAKSEIEDLQDKSILKAPLIGESTTNNILTVPLNTAASDATLAGLNIAEGVAPTSPIDGDVWVTAAGAFNTRLNGVTVDLSAGGGGGTAVDVINGGLGTGIVSGGVLFVGAGTTTFSITDGQGVIVDNTTSPTSPTITNVTWSGLTDITVTNIGTQLITFVYITSGGAVIQSGSRPTREIARDNLIVGVVIHVDQATVDTINQQQNLAINAPAQIGDVINALGFINVSGNLFAPNGANLNIDKSIGIMMGQGINWDIDPKNPHQKTLSSLAPATFQYRFQDGSNGVTGIAIDPENYDVGGSITSVPAKKYTVQRIYSFTSNNVKIQMGQTVYNSIKDAKAALTADPFVTEPSIAANGLLRGFLIMKEDATDLTDTNRVLFVEAGKFGQAGGTGGGSSADAEDVILTVEKGSVGTINSGQAVYASGYDATSQKTEVELAQSDSISTMPSIGIARSTITDTTAGEIVMFGSLKDQNTSGYAVGDRLYISDSVAGDLQNTKPAGTAFVQAVGIVVRVDASEGIIEVFGAGRGNELPNIPEDHIWIGDSTGAPTTLKNNFGATTDPLVTSDSASNYATGSRWINETTDKEFVCLDATASSAVWIETTGAGSGIANIVEDTTPQLGGDLDTNDFDITGPVKSSAAFHHINIVPGIANNGETTSNDINITGGECDFTVATGTVAAGDVNITGGGLTNRNENATGGSVNIVGASLPLQTSAENLGIGGGINITAGSVPNATTSAYGGDMVFKAGDAYASAGGSYGGDITIKSGSGWDFSGDIILEAGGNDAGGGNAWGSVYIQASVPSAYGVAGPKVTELRLLGLQANTTLTPAGRILNNYVGLKAPDNIGSGEYSLTLPAALPAADGDILSSTTAGVMSFISTATPTATTAELIDYTDAINTTALKVAGYMVFNTTTGAPVWAVGANDTSVWNDATGSLAHTPV